MKKIDKIVRLVVKVVGNYCNLRCSYCFYQDNDQQEITVMSNELVEKIIKQYLAIDQPSYTFIWHGGEPILAGLEFYQHIINIQNLHKKPGQEINNAIQTNATLINDEWAIFLKKNNFEVGVSIDGCEKSHNQFRCHNGGEGSFQSVLRGIKALQRNGISPGYIQTITKAILENAADDFMFFTEVINAKSWGMNYYVDKSGGKMSEETVTADEMANHVIKYIDLWLARNDKDLNIREIENYFRPFLEREANTCDFSGYCGHFLCIDWNGDVYPCDRLSNLANFFLGSLESHNFLDILNDSALSDHRENMALLGEECSDCRWLQYCFNGCIHHRSPNELNKFHYCEGRKKVFAYVETLALKFGICADSSS